MIKLELTPNEAVWIFERILRERAKALALIPSAKMLANSEIDAARNDGKEFFEIQERLKALGEKVKAGIDDYLKTNHENENGGGGEN